MLYTCENCKQTFESEEECELHEDMCGIPESKLTTRVNISVDQESVVVNKKKIKISDKGKWWNLAKCQPYVPVEFDKDVYQIDYWEDEHTKKEAMLKLADKIRESVLSEIESIKARQVVLDGLCDRADELEKMAEEKE